MDGNIVKEGLGISTYREGGLVGKLVGLGDDYCGIGVSGRFWVLVQAEE